MASDRKLGQLLRDVISFNCRNDLQEFSGRYPT